MLRHKMEFKKECSSERVNFHRCNMCSYKTKMISLLKKHVQNQHVRSEISIKTIRCMTELEKYKCFECNYETHFIVNLRKHTCLKKCVKRVTWKEHVIIQHTGPGNMKWFECGHCSYKYIKENLKKHILQEHLSSEVNWFQCAYCSFKTKDHGDLKKHTLVKHASPENVNWFQCECCSFKTKLKGVLKNHIMWKHTSAEKIHWFQCVYCSFKTKTSNNCLLKHKSL